MNLLIVAVVVLVLALAVVVAWKVMSRNKKEDPASFARRLGLTDSGGVLHGQNQGFAVVVETLKRGPATTQTRTVFRIDFPHLLGLGLSVMRRHPGKRSLRTLATGDAGFDDSVAVEAKEQKKARDYLTPERRACIQKLLADDPRAFISDQGLCWSRDGAIGEFAILERILNDLLDAAVELFPGRAARKAARRAEKEAHKPQKA